MTHLHLALCCGVALCGISCGDTGIIVSVSGQSVSELEFVVGVERDGRFVLDGNVSGTVVDVRDRNLRARPYELLLRQPQEGDVPRIQVMARGWRVENNGNRRLMSFGVMDPPQPFDEDALLRRRIALGGIGGQNATSALNGCYTARIGEMSWRWIVPGNVDCDPVRADADPPDCDDEDERLYPGASELCDGRDNSCDGQLGPENGLCYAPATGEEGPCREGRRFCERPGQGAGACTPGEAPAPEAFCARFASCADRADPRPCLFDATRDARSCVHRSNANGEPCGPAKVLLEPPRGADSCRWVIFDAGGGLSASFGGSRETSNCKPTLDLSASAKPLSGSVTLDFFANDQAGWLVEVALSAETVETCEGVEAMVCE